MAVNGLYWGIPLFLFPLPCWRVLILVLPADGLFNPFPGSVCYRSTFKGHQTVAQCNTSSVS